MPRNIRLLVGAHVVGAIAPAATFLVPPNLKLLPLLWTLSSIPLAQAMLLSFWAGMGNGKRIFRFGGACLGIAYLAVWSTLGSFLSASSADKGPTAWLGIYFGTFGLMFALALLSAGIFLLARRWFAELRRISKPEQPLSPARYQYSLLQVLVITSLIAIVLALMRSAKPEPTGNWHIVAPSALMTITFLINTMCAAWAVLAMGPIRLRVTLVFLVAVFLGVALAITGRTGSVAWWLFPSRRRSNRFPVETDRPECRSRS